MTFRPGCASSLTCDPPGLPSGGAPQPQDEPAYPEEPALYTVDAQMSSTPESLVVREGANITLPCKMEGEHGKNTPTDRELQLGTENRTKSRILLSSDRTERSGDDGSGIFRFDFVLTFVVSKSGG